MGNYFLFKRDKYPEESLMKNISNYLTLQNTREEMAGYVYLIDHPKHPQHWCILIWSI